MFQNETEEFVIADDVIEEFIGSSILLISLVDMIDEGLYYCVASYNDNVNITSDMATLEIDNSKLVRDREGKGRGGGGGGRERERVREREREGQGEREGQREGQGEKERGSKERHVLL